MTKADISEKINNFLIDEFEIEEDLINPDATFKDELGLESLDFVDIVVIIEKEFGFKVNGEEIVNIRKLSDLYDYVDKHVNVIA